MAFGRAVVCRVEMGLGPSLPPAEPVRRDSALSRKMDAYFLLRRMQNLVEIMLSLLIKLVYLLDSMSEKLALRRAEKRSF